MEIAEQGAAYIGWDSLAYEADTASFEIVFNEPINAEATSSLTFEMSEAKGSTYPDKKRDKEKKKKENGNEEDNENDNSEENNEGNANNTEDINEDEDEDEEDKKAPEPIDFTIQLTDLNDSIVSFKLSDYSYLQRQLSVDVLKNTELQSTKRSEAVYNTFFFNLSQLSSETGFDSNAIKAMKFVFDQSKKGLIILDKVAIH